MRTMRVVIAEENFDSEAPGEPSTKQSAKSIRPSLRRAAIAGISVWVILPVVLLVSNLHQPENAAIWAVATGIFVGPAILGVLCPTDYFLPRSSRFWHPGWMALFGLISGTLFLFVAGVILGGGRSFQWEALIGSAVGGGTYGALMALVLALLNRKRK